jgi:hypothetical protein
LSRAAEAALAHEAARLLGLADGAEVRDTLRSLALCECAYKQVEMSREDVARALNNISRSFPPALGASIDALQIGRVDADQKLIVAAADDALYVAFMGTKTARDVVADLDYVHRPLFDESASVAADRSAVPTAHRGFLSRARRVDVAALRRAAEASGRRLVLSGHSLGGAVAKLCALRLLREEEQEEEQRRLAVDAAELEEQQQQEHHHHHHHHRQRRHLLRRRNAGSSSIVRGGLPASFPLSCARGELTRTGSIPGDEGVAVDGPRPTSPPLTVAQAAAQRGDSAAAPPSALLLTGVGGVDGGGAGISGTGNSSASSLHGLSATAPSSAAPSSLLWPPHLRCITFATPAIGNAALAELVETAGWGGYFRNYALPEDELMRTLAIDTYARLRRGGEGGTAGASSSEEEGEGRRKGLAAAAATTAAAAPSGPPGSSSSAVAPSAEAAAATAAASKAEEGEGAVAAADPQATSPSPLLSAAAEDEAAAAAGVPRPPSRSLLRAHPPSPASLAADFATSLGAVVGLLAFPWARGAAKRRLARELESAERRDEGDAAAAAAVHAAAERAIAAAGAAVAAAAAPDEKEQRRTETATAADPAPPAAAAPAPQPPAPPPPRPSLPAAARQSARDVARTLAGLALLQQRWLAYSLRHATRAAQRPLAAAAHVVMRDLYRPFGSLVYVLGGTEDGFAPRGTGGEKNGSHHHHLQQQQQQQRPVPARVAPLGSDEATAAIADAAAAVAAGAPLDVASITLRHLARAFRRKTAGLQQPQAALSAAAAGDKSAAAAAAVSAAAAAAAAASAADFYGALLPAAPPPSGSGYSNHRMLAYRSRFLAVIASAARSVEAQGVALADVAPPPPPLVEPPPPALVPPPAPTATGVPGVPLLPLIPPPRVDVAVARCPLPSPLSPAAAVASGAAAAAKADDSGNGGNGGGKMRKREVAAAAASAAAGGGARP